MWSDTDKAELKDVVLERKCLGSLNVGGTGPFLGSFSGVSWEKVMT